MISKEMNEMLTRTGPGTDAGSLLRYYWQPAALSEELENERPVVPVRLLGENLVLFRNLKGELGLIGRNCPHRGVDLAYGRLEEEGLRCPFHGWYFNANGRCLEQPAEPETSRMHEKITTKSYPVVEKNGIVFAYMGPGDPPKFPNFDCFRAPQSHVFAFKGLWHCNWLQGLEVGIDPAHASFLHRFLQDDEINDGYGQQFRDDVADTQIPMTKLLREYPRPEISVEQTEFGLQLIALRHMQHGQTHVRTTNQIFPQAICIPMSREMNIVQWHVPIDDEHCYWYSMFVSFDQPVNKHIMREQRLKEHHLPLYVPVKNEKNDYGYDYHQQRTQTYTGMGFDINVHDQWAVESPGPVFDRTKEHLGKTDVGIVKYRRLLRSAITAVKESRIDDLPMYGLQDPDSLKGPLSNDSIGDSNRWREVSEQSERSRRAACKDWDAT